MNQQDKEALKVLATGAVVGALFAVGVYAEGKQPGFIRDVLSTTPPPDSPLPVAPLPENRLLTAGEEQQSTFVWTPKRQPNGRPYEPHTRRGGARRVSQLTLKRTPTAEPTRSREYHAEQYVKLFRQEQPGATVGQIEAGFKSDARPFMPDGRKRNSGAREDDFTRAVRAGLEAQTPRETLKAETFTLTKAKVEKDISLGKYRTPPSEAAISKMHEKRFRSAISRIKKRVSENF